MGLSSDGVHGQLLPEGFLFSPVGKPVVDSHFSDQIRAEALSFGGGDASLKTLGSAGKQMCKVKNWCWYCLGNIFQGRCRKASWFCTCCTPLPKIPAPPCWGSSAVHTPGTGFAETQAPT